ncbi:hypothetical protein [Paractinoplanes maris]|uniref:hypothetical protein n=1 Tax=Paractinoplanes maris TaxID=1734446 RepID=UPI00202053B3|nr:hypothetical protein [Actinoplanes maris]
MPARPCANVRDEHHRPNRLLVGFGAAVVALAAVVSLLLSAPHLDPAKTGASCPERASVPAYAGERRMLVRSEKRVGATAVVHLCLDRAAGPVHSWSIRTADGSPIAVQRVADDVAVAVLPSIEGHPTLVTVTVQAHLSDPLTFTARM